MKYYIEYMKVFFHCLINLFPKENSRHCIVIERYLDNKEKCLFKKVNCYCEIIK